MNRSALSSICRNVPNDKPYHSARLRNFEISTQSLNQLELVLNDRELFTSADAVFPLIDPEALVKLQRIWRVFHFLSFPADLTVAVLAGKAPNSMNRFFWQEKARFRLYLLGICANVARFVINWSSGLVCEIWY